MFRPSEAILIHRSTEPKKQTWEDFFKSLRRYQIGMGGMTEKGQTAYISTCRGKAEHFLNDIPDSRWKTYQELQQAMQREFGVAKQLH